ncbi:tigger transposable element-derived protein 1-like [Erpetoichthys calabaricus]|uniref:tigger transposable element-derived protein 1-like n=1 Tax=Erpetoichthys calabaricus TaxID=27687 RepID=UPI002234801D|nr:tigger transposable element-derived protein 1-like [Erpetoichthys calabaricus]
MTVSTIVKNKDVIKSANVAKGMKSFTKQRSRTLEHVEKLLLIWITEKQCAGDSVSEAMICEKAKLMHADLFKNKAGMSQESEVFKASHGRFDNFKMRTGIHSVVRHREGASADKDASNDFVTEFGEFVEAEGFVPQQIFNCDETGLFWKKMPNRTYITQEEKALPGHKPVKDRLTLLFCGNASGDCKLKPLLIYHSENQRAFKKHNMQKTQLPVMWKSNSKAWVTREYFSEWFNVVFGPSVKSYLEEKNLPLKALLIMDNAPAHPSSLQDYVLPELDFITVKFLPPNTTPLIQAMDQQAISNFKKLYTKALFQRCFEVISDTELTLREFWKDHFTIVHCITLIDKAWQDVSYRTMNSTWRNLWPEAVTERDFEGFEAVPVLEDIVSLGMSMGLDVSDGDVEELVEGHREQLTTEELQELEKEEHKTKVDALSSGLEEKEIKEAPTSLIKEIVAKWMDVKNFARSTTPTKPKQPIIALSGMTRQCYISETS